MPNRKTISLSPSALNAYEWCGASWLGQYYLKVPGTEFVVTPDVAVGKAVHRVMQKVNLRRKEGKATSLTELRDWADDYWKEEKVAIPDAKDMSDIADAKYRVWAREHAIAIAGKTRGHIPALIENYASMPLIDGWVIGGYRDVVLADGRVFDFKTSTTKAFTTRDREKYKLQAAIYAAIAREETGSIPEVHLITSDTEGCEDYPVPLTPTSVDDALDHARRVATEIDHLLETGTPFSKPKNCRFCSLAGNCPTQVAPLAAA